jgi:hypothetical protein
VWATLVGVGFGALQRYAGTPGERGTPAEQWLGAPDLGLDPARPTLILFAHPRCPCTRATLEELDRLLAVCKGGLRAHVVFYSDPALGEGWERTDLWDRAAAIPGVEVCADPGGLLALRFGAGTSGECLVYGTGGQRLFAGGITASRGHAGDNLGAQAIAGIVRGEPAAAQATDVFGCSLRGDRAPAGPSSAPQAEEVPRD